MRDPKRINKFCDHLKAVWHQFPDLRFGQLVQIVLNDLPYPNSSFYIEDEELIKHFENWAKENSVKGN